MPVEYRRALQELEKAQATSDGMTIGMQAERLIPMMIYGDMSSGNCLKVKFTADKLGMPYEWRPIDVVAGETRRPEFLAMSPMGQVPVVELDDGRRAGAVQRHHPLSGARQLAASGRSHITQAKIDEWLFWEQYSHEPYVAVCRFHMKYLGKHRDELEPWRVQRGEAALDLLDAAAQRRPWLAADRFIDRRHRTPRLYALRR